MIRFSLVLCYLSFMSVLIAKPVATVHPQFDLTRQQFEQTLVQLDPLIQAKILAQPKQFLDLMIQVIQQDKQLYQVVDREHRLSLESTPPDLVNLYDYDWAILSRPQHQIRRIVVSSLQAMTQAAKQDGLALQVSSAYRSGAYQQQVYQRWINQLGEVQAKRLSAPAGASQHQLGTAIDFGIIDASFTGTPLQRWLVQHAYDYGFSLSYPNGHEEKTGYAYESWHYRYIGQATCILQREFFGDLQYILLQWLQAYYDTYQQASLVK